MSLDRLCRLCAEEKSNMFPILEEPEPIRKIDTCLGIKVSSNDLLPKLLCSNCITNVDMFFTFKLACLSAEQKLNNLLTATVINPKLPVVKQEIVDASHRFHSPIDDHSYCALLITQTLKSNVKKEYIEEHQSDEEIFETNDTTSTVINCKPKTECKLQFINPSAIVDVQFNNDSSYQSEVMCKLETIPSDGLPTATDPCVTVVDPHLLEYLNVEEVNVSLPVEESADPSKWDFNDTASLIQSEDLANENLGYQSPFPEFSESDFVLREGEECDIDFEDIEVSKKTLENVKFKCESCPREFKHLKALKKHCSSIHENQPDFFPCVRCTKEKGTSHEFSSLNALNKHITNIHPLRYKFKCKFCAESFRIPSDLLSHEKEHGLHQFPCRQCSSILSSKSRLLKHIKALHSDSISKVCDICDKSFKTVLSLRDHKRSHEGNTLRKKRIHLCPMCGIQKPTLQSLNDHLNNHHNKKPYKCQTCPFSSSCWSSLKKHQLFRHTKGRFKCNDCNRDFIYKTLLRRHMAKHSDEKLFACEICSKSFKYKNSVTRHKQICHKEAGND